ncbi:glycogen/starch/alpha-glucan phosphorylase [Cryptosporangium phraense]|uniref:glycogen/starch/alpha-glucan phosphorylase n=1 Tax=Cryptosporangium phraense TaxID=2593070 RepID=UPI00197A96EE|nr:glycogen/starch/alpha-glucan phosphorylase [Cryptosporangium phraense]
MDLRALGNTPQDFARDLLSNLYYERGTTVESASAQDMYDSLARTVRDRLAERRARTAAAHYQANPRWLYYLSAEYMLGRQLEQNLLYTGTTDLAREAVPDFDTTAAQDVEPGLGNGGLGRLAACLLDSLATMDLPAVGYGIRYDLGIFKQDLDAGGQVERPDDWAFQGNPWEFPAPDDNQVVGFYGKVTSVDGRREWEPAETVLGEPSHMLVPGYGTDTVNIVRLWRARAAQGSFDLTRFAHGQYAEAVADVVRSENISKVLYPDDSTDLGRELRLKQQYFLVSCSLRDIIRRFSFRNDGNWDEFAAKTTIQLNDTHPVLAIPELMRLLVDEYELDWDRAWRITHDTFGYTCHTLLPEALETWPVATIENLLPRHLEIIYEINARFLAEVSERFPGDVARIQRMSLVQEEPERRIRMANLAVVGSRAVNGVAALHSQLLAETTLRDFAELWPGRFHNVTNGVTPRRFVKIANPALSDLISSALGSDAWLRDLSLLQGLEPFAADDAFRARWREIKRANKLTLGVAPDFLTDVIVKRFHEYKRQLLKLLHTITLYQRIRAGETPAPRTVVFAGKAAPGYWAVKDVIRLINAVAATVNNDPAVAPYLKVFFPANYNVTLGQRIYPAADLSEQISLAGKEASGTGNMKLALNGAVTIGTLDGANVEIRDRVGADNFFLFGLDAAEAATLRSSDYRPRDYYERDDELRAAVDAIGDGTFAGGDRQAFGGVLASLLDRDEYLTLADFRSYLDAQAEVEKVWLDAEAWTAKSILNTARSGYFSSDRTIADYTRTIWGLDPVRVNP